MLARMGRAIKGIFTGRSALLGGLSAIAAGAGLLKLASDAEELRSAFDIVFGASADDARKWAADLAKSLGRSRLSIMEFATEVQDTFVPLGFAREEAAELSKAVVQLGIDLASLKSFSVTEKQALQAMTSALVGNREAVRSLGVIIDDLALKQALAELGFKGAVKEASKQQRVLSTLKVIVESTADAQGNAAATAGSLANQWKRFTGILKDFGAAIGGILLPAATEILRTFSEFAELLEANRETFKRWGESLGASVGKVTGLVRLLVRGFGTDSEAAWRVVTAGFALGLAKLRSMVLDFVQWLSGVLNKVVDAAIEKLRVAFPDAPILGELKGLAALGDPEKQRGIAHGFGNIAAALAGKKPITEFDKQKRKESLQIAAASKEFKEAMAALKALIPDGKAAGDPFDFAELIERLFAGAGGDIEAKEKKKKKPGFEFASFSDLWKQTQTKLGKEKDKLLKLAEEDAVVQKKILVAVDGIPLARWT